MNLLQYHIIAFSLGVLLDRIIGDPYNLPHPIRLIGRVIGRGDHILMDASASSPRRQFWKGVLLSVIVLLLTGITTAGITVFSYLLHPVFGCLVEGILTCYILAAKSLKKESYRVYHQLIIPDLPKARSALSMIVGRDTDQLTFEGVSKACVETVAENTSDGVIAPMLYTAFGGPVAGMLYKAINTMDSMIGYKNERYLHFGTFAARLDDIVNYLPARCSAIAMILAAFLGGKDYSGRQAIRIFLRDRYNHKSPNSAQTESVCAGALGLELAGPASYFKKIVQKPTIGDKKREVEAEDIPRSCRLMFMTEDLTFLLCDILLITIFILR
jgi:adenosylcobinamide-phosphate synthase